MSIVLIHKNVFSVFAAMELAAQVKLQPNVIITPVVSESPTTQKLLVSSLRNNFSLLPFWSYSVYVFVVLEDLCFVVYI